MNVLAVTKGILGVTAVATLGVMVVAGGPWSGAPPGELMTKLMLFPFIAAWAMAPYFVAHKFALQSEGQEGWLLIAAIPVTAIPVIWIYVQSMILSDVADAHGPMAFVVFPIYQSLFILAVWGATRLWRGYFRQ